MPQSVTELAPSNGRAVNTPRSSSARGRCCAEARAGARAIIATTSSARRRRRTSASLLLERELRLATNALVLPKEFFLKVIGPHDPSYLFAVQRARRCAAPSDPRAFSATVRAAHEGTMSQRPEVDGHRRSPHRRDSREWPT